MSNLVRNLNRAQSNISCVKLFLAEERECFPQGVRARDKANRDYKREARRASRRIAHIEAQLHRDECSSDLC